MSVSISPVYNEAQYFDNDGNPLSGGKIFQYEAGSFTVQQTSFSDEAGNIANPNPIVLDSSGRQPTTLYLTDGSAYNLVLTLPDGTTILDYKDFVVGVEPASSFNTGVELWNTVVDTPTYVNGTTFLLPGNYAANFSVGNRVRITYDDATAAFGTVSAVVFSSPNTQVTIVNDAGTLQSNMSFAAWSSLIVNGRTVDAAGVKYTTSLTYSAGSVGNKIQTMETSLNASIAAVNSKVVRNQTWISADYVTPNTYTASLSPVPTTLTEPQTFTVIFIQGNGGTASTLNINGLGAYPLQTYNSGGGLENARITAFMTSQVVFGGASYLVLDRLPDAATTAPRGIATYGSNNTFTVPAGVTSIKVTCVGGGGLGDTGTGDYSSFPPQLSLGPGGGGAATAVKYLSVSPGQTYAVSIGAGGTVGSLGTGGATSFGISLVVANGGTTAAGSNSGTGDIIFAGGNGFIAVSNGVGGSTQGGGQWPLGYGCGGSGALGIGAGTDGIQGFCMVEW